MIAAPAVDLRQGRCVQLVGGRPEEERISLPDAKEWALRWWETGFGHLHVVDLDAALSLGHNRDLMSVLLRETPAVVQAGGGVRSEEDVELILGLGARRVVVGTRAVKDPEWLELVAMKHPGRLMVAADTREGRVLLEGWTEASALPLQALLDRLDPLPVGGVLWTDVAREGRMGGVDRSAAREVVRGSRHPVWISGGVSTLDELRALRDAGAAGVVLGMALYTGRLSPEAVAQEFGA